MAAERLSAQDATLLYAQDQRAPLIIGAVCRFERAPLADADGRLRTDDLRRHLASRLHLVPRFRQRLALVPGDSGRPRWVDDTDFDIRNHAHGAQLPAPGGERELHAFVAELLAVPLDPRRPLWELWTVDGLDGDRVAVVLKVSHVMADGLALLGFALALLDFEPDVAPVEPPSWVPEPAPSGTRLLADTLVDQARTWPGPRWAPSGHSPDPAGSPPTWPRSVGPRRPWWASLLVWRSTARSVTAVASCCCSSRRTSSWR